MNTIEIPMNYLEPAIVYVLEKYSVVEPGEEPCIKRVGAFSKREDVWKWIEKDLIEELNNEKETEGRYWSLETCPWIELSKYRCEVYEVDNEVIK